MKISFFKDAFEGYLHNTDVSSLRRLGNGNSSRHAAEKLFDTYEEAAQTVTDNPENAALIANAYARINRFYISHDLYSVGAFFNDTPAY